MNAAKNIVASPAASTSTTPRPARGLRIAMALFLGMVCVVAFVVRQATGAAQAVESAYVNAVRPESSRLNAAREALKRGDREHAIHDYSASIELEPETAEAAIPELTQVFLKTADAHSKEARYADESAQINRCYKMLKQIAQVDERTKSLAAPVRTVLFREIERVRQIGNNAAKCHILAADHLRMTAKGTWNDDENMQAEALRKINLAWSYYPDFMEEWMVNKMYEIWADMKSELPTWQYNQVMECDRLQLGRVVGDK